MIKIIGTDNTIGKNVLFNCKCDGCGAIFEADLDEFELVSGKDMEYRLRVRCPRCDNALFYEVINNG